MERPYPVSGALASLGDLPSGGREVVMAGARGARMRSDGEKLAPSAVEIATSFTLVYYIW